MMFDAQTIFANLTEKERLYGHHSPEGRALRTLGRALSGWSAQTLAANDVLTLCEQATEDWLKARLKLSQWSAKSITELLALAVTREVISRLEAVQLQRLHNQRPRAEPSSISTAQVEARLALCIQIIEKRWR